MSNHPEHVDYHLRRDPDWRVAAPGYPVRREPPPPRVIPRRRPTRAVSRGDNGFRVEEYPPARLLGSTELHSSPAAQHPWVDPWTDPHHAAPFPSSIEETVETETTMITPVGVSNPSIVVFLASLMFVGVAFVVLLMSNTAIGESVGALVALAMLCGGGLLFARHVGHNPNPTGVTDRQLRRSTRRWTLGR